MDSITIQWQGIELEVTGEYWRAEPESRSEPGIGSTYEVETILYKGERQKALEDSEGPWMEICELACEACDKGLEEVDYD